MACVAATWLACSDEDEPVLGAAGAAGATPGASGNGAPRAGNAGAGGDTTGGTPSGASQAGEPSAGARGGTAGSTNGGSAGSLNGGTGGVPEEVWTLPEGATLASCVPASWTVSAAFSAEGNPPSYAVDGLAATRWSNGTAQGPGEYYEVAFGGWVTLSQVVLDSAGSAGDYPRAYEARASKDGVSFTKVLAAETLAAAPEGDVVTIDFEPTPLQAIRIGTTVTTGNWWSIHELSLACKGSDDGTPPLDPLLCTPAGADDGAGGAGGAGGQTSSGGSDGALGDDDDALNPQNWTATASNSNAGDEVEDAFDGALGTRWSSGKPQTGDEWYQLDLGSIACISSLWLVSGGGDAASALTLEVSVDGVEYVAVWKGAGSAVSEIQFPAHSARFVRIKQVGNGGANWWSIQEIEVRR